MKKTLIGLFFVDFFKIVCYSIFIVKRRKQMTVGELVKKLQKQDQNKQIKIWDNVSVDAYPIQEIEEYFDNDVVLTF